MVDPVSITVLSSVVIAVTDILRRLKDRGTAKKLEVNGGLPPLVGSTGGGNVESWEQGGAFGSAKVGGAGSGLLTFRAAGSIALVVLVLAAIYLFTLSPKIQAVPGWMTTVGLCAFYFVLMLLGMAGQYMWGLKHKSEFNINEFVRPIWVSLIVFTPFWNTVSDAGISYATIAGAYQNGFFWKIVFEQQGRTMKAKVSKQKPKKP